jgi:hypothetical protein
MEEQERKAQFMFDEMDDFFTSETVTLDVRVTYQFDAKLAENAPKRFLRDKIRREMISKFRKELTRQMRDQI